MIANYGDFCRELLKAGFSGAIGGNDDGVFGLFRYGWGAEDESGLYWHTGDPETDPWEWRVRVLRERDDVAYGKVFFRKAGYITREWYPYFLAARRGGRDFEDFYADGLVSRESKQVVGALSERGKLPAHELRQLSGLEKKSFDKAISDLQSGLFITMCGAEQKRNQMGEGYGWNSMTYCRVEDFWGGDISANIGKQEAIDAITERVFTLNPNANGKRVKKFILG